MYQPPLGSFRRRLEVARQSNDLYFAALLDRQTIAAAFGQASGILDSARIYTTAVTLWIFLSKVRSIDRGCVSAVARLIHYRCARSLRACSSETGMYCSARDKLCEAAMHRLVVTTGRRSRTKLRINGYGWVIAWSPPTVRRSP